MSKEFANLPRKY